MDSQLIIRQVNAFLHEATVALADWLSRVLPRVSSDWWQDCVLRSLTYAQREIAEAREYTKLTDFDLSALLRIMNKSWYDMRTVMFLPTDERETARAMQAVRNNWAHLSVELPGKDTILSDLKTILKFMRQTGGEESVCKEIEDFIAYIEKPDSVPDVFHPA